MNLYTLVLFFAAFVAAGQETDKKVEIAIQKKDGTITTHLVGESVAGKIELLPGDVTLIEGQPLRLTTLDTGAKWVKFFLGTSVLFLGESVRLVTAGGADVREYSDGILLPPGEWKVMVIAGNEKGWFSDTITVRVLSVKWGNK